MKLIVGLGNPGKEYEKTRHNSGFMVVDAFLHELEFEPFQNNKNMEAQIGTGNYKGEKVIIAKPLTFMNLSGNAVSAIMRFYKIKPRDLVVIYDDLDLPLGQIRIRKSGSAGTHNGMKSIVECLGTISFPRIRIGIESRGSSAPIQQDTSSFVLEPFNKQEAPLAKEGIQKAKEALFLALNEGAETAMNEYNKK